VCVDVSGRVAGSTVDGCVGGWMDGWMVGWFDVSTMIAGVGEFALCARTLWMYGRTDVRDGRMGCMDV